MDGTSKSPEPTVGMAPVGSKDPATVKTRGKERALAPEDQDMIRILRPGPGRECASIRSSSIGRFEPARILSVSQRNRQKTCH